MSGGGAVALGSSTTLTNAGVTSVAAGTGISVSASTGGVTITNTATSAYVGQKGQVFTSSGTFTIPTGVTALKITVIGAGGSAGNNGSCGAGGASAFSYLTGLTAGNTIAVTVGSGGTARVNNASGITGGTSSVASGTQSITTISCTGGGGGYGAGFWTTNATGGTASGGDTNLSGNSSSYLDLTSIGSGYFVYSGTCQYMFNNQARVWAGLQPPSGLAGTIGCGGGTNDYGTGGSGTGGNGIVIFEW